MVTKFHIQGCYKWCNKCFKHEFHVSNIMNCAEFEKTFGTYLHFIPKVPLFEHGSKKGLSFKKRYAVLKQVSYPNVYYK